MASFDKVKVALKNKIEKGLDYNLEGEPVLRLKNRKQFIITQCCGGWYVKRDYGMTYKELLRDVDFDKVVELIINEGK